MPLLTINHPDTSVNEITSLEASSAIGATTLTVRDTDGFSANDYIAIGKIGEERSEIKKIGSVTPGSSFTVEALVHPHPAHVTITKVKFNQAKIYRSTTEAGSYSLIATVNLQIDRPNGTNYDDSTGTDSSWYKITYYNSYLAAESDYSDPIQATGHSRNTAGWMIDDVLWLVSDERNSKISREDVLKLVDLHQTLWWFAPYNKRELKGVINLTTTAGQNYVELPATFDRLRGGYPVRYEYTPDASIDKWYFLEVLSENRFVELYNDMNADDSDELKACSLDETSDADVRRLKLGPAPLSGSKNIEIKCYLKPTALNSEGDTVVCPVPRLITLSVAIEILKGWEQNDKAAGYMTDLQALQAGEIYHSREQTGSTTIIFRKDRGRRRYSGANISEDGE